MTCELRLDSDKEAAHGAAGGGEAAVETPKHRVLAATGTREQDAELGQEVGAMRGLRRLAEPPQAEAFKPR